MNSERKKIISILKEAETKVQGVISAAAGKGDYGTVDKARATAIAIRSLRSKMGVFGSKQKNSTHKITSSDYPRFEVRSNRLIRTGWSKKQEEEYTHKVPEGVFNATVKVMAALAQKRTGPVTAEEIIERITTQDSKKIPAYQIYVVLGMLRSQDCIEQVGREGYEIPAEIEMKAEKVWKSLSRRSDDV